MLVLLAIVARGVASDRYRLSARVAPERMPKADATVLAFLKEIQITDALAPRQQTVNRTPRLVLRAKRQIGECSRLKGNR